MLEKFISAIKFKILSYQTSHARANGFGCGSSITKLAHKLESALWGNRKDTDRTREDDIEADEFVEMDPISPRDVRRKPRLKNILNK
ncbi:MAG: hypothetical protein WC523_00275 [Patescibacteria group bacterium]